MAARFTTMMSTKFLADKIVTNPVNFRLVDASWYLSNPRQEFRKKHIPGAQFFDIDDCCDKASQYKHMLPTPHHFEEYVGKLGICNETHVVLYDNNESLGLFSAPRVWWTFRTFGHDLVSILDGGLPKWERDGFDVDDNVGYVEPKTFKANFKPESVKSFEEMQRNLEEKSFTVVDARSAERFSVKPGHMPNAVNIPYASILNPETKTIKSPEELKELFKDKGIDLASDKPIAATCGSGISACIVALGAHLCGRDDVMVYDGSWTEWSQRAKREEIISAK